MSNEGIAAVAAAAGGLLVGGLAAGVTRVAALPAPDVGDGLPPDGAGVTGLP
ncbi:hypothetical protein [Cryptosporangium sp. NPDC048952]|uniref:hypothetical protein n=1 Tax=Cryptosporangium sp. NPDC048952 TaxID=3363961 RepID=UPI0037175B7E